MNKIDYLTAADTPENETVLSAVLKIFFFFLNQ